MTDIVLIVHNVRSCHNVGSLLRTAEGLGVKMVYFTGYTPYPKIDHDDRLPHIADKLTRQIHKTALGAESLITWKHHGDIEELLSKLQSDYEIVALEQHDTSIPIYTFRVTRHVALVIGREVEGIEPTILAKCDRILEIPMQGQKESFNVVQAAAMALFYFTWAR